jgi:hypothetical protein
MAADDDQHEMAEELPPSGAEAEAIRRFLESYLAVAGVTRKEVDERLGETPGFTSRFLRGEARFTLERADRIGDILGVRREVADAMRKAAEIHLPAWWPQRRGRYDYDQYPADPIPQQPEVGMRHVLAALEDLQRAVLAQLPPGEPVAGSGATGAKKEKKDRRERKKKADAPA